MLLRLWLRLSPRRRRRSFRMWRRSGWRRHTLASWLFLSHRPGRSFSLRRTGPTLGLLLLSARLLLGLRSLLLRLNATRFTLFLTTASRLLNRSLRLLLLHRSLRCLSGLLWWATAAAVLALITHLELLSLRMIRRIVHAHPLREIWPELRCDRSRARDDGGVV